MEKTKILVIDDEEDYCSILKSHFTQRNCEVLLAYTLQTGLNCLAEAHPDILFLDNNLPDGDGWQQVNAIMAQYPLLRIYLVSAHKNRSDFKIHSPRITIWEKPISMFLLKSIHLT